MLHIGIYFELDCQDLPFKRRVINVKELITTHLVSLRFLRLSSFVDQNIFILILLLLPIFISSSTQEPSYNETKFKVHTIFKQKNLFNFPYIIHLTYLHLVSEMRRILTRTPIMTQAVKKTTSMTVLE